MPKDWHLTFPSLARYPNLRRVHGEGELFAQYGSRHHMLRSHSSPPSSLSHMRHLIRISLGWGRQLSIDDVCLLATHLCWYPSQRQVRASRAAVKTLCDSGVRLPATSSSAVERGKLTRSHTTLTEMNRRKTG